MPIVVKYKKIVKDIEKPFRKHATDSCYDLYVAEEVFLLPGETKMVPTGMAFEIPEFFEGQIRPRSSSSKSGLLVHFGTIDSGYRGQVYVITTNLNRDEMILKKKTRIAQMAIKPIQNVGFLEVDELDDSDRGENGYGSTGK